MPTSCARSLGAHLRPLTLLLVASGCAAHGPRVPGPLGAVGKDPPPVAVLRPHDVLLAEPEPEPEPASRKRSGSDLGHRIADAARHWVDHRPRGFRDDCSGFVMAALDRAGQPMSGSTASFWEEARTRGLVHHRSSPASATWCSSTTPTTATATAAGTTT